MLLGDRLKADQLPFKSSRRTQGFTKGVIGNVRFVQNLRQYRVPFRDTGYLGPASHDEST